VNAWRKRQLILRAVRAGLATNVRPAERGFDALLGRKEDIWFDLPGGIMVMIVIGRQSLQYQDERWHEAVGGKRACRLVLKALVAHGFVDEYDPSRPWDTLADVVKEVTT
jgi:hypothetical protein